MNNKNPWLGLRTYVENDRIYGRDKEKVQLANLIEGNLHTIIYGKSGVGKSSLLQAGVFPLLRDEDMFPVYMRLEHNSTKSYFEQIKEAVMAASSFRVEQGENVMNTVKQFLTETSFIDDDIRCRQYPVLVFDQFEEIFTLTDMAHKQDVASFFDNIADALDVENPCFRIVICLREDYLYYLEQNSVRIPDLKRNRFGLKALNKEQATEIITKPCHGIVADDVVDYILNKVSVKGSEEYEPAILSLFMYSLFEKMKLSGAEVISKSLVDTFGDNIISDFYNSSTKTISDTSMEFVEEHLLTDGGYRHNIPVDDARRHGVTDEEIKRLVSNRIVTIIPNANNVDYMEFTHDVLCAVATKSRNDRRLRIQKRKNRRRMSIMAVVIVLVIAVAGSFIWQYYEMDKRQQAMMKMQSRATAGMVKLNMEEENVLTSIALLLEVLPENIEKPDRPLVGEPLTLLYELFDSRLRNAWRHDNYVKTAAFSPDGRYVVTASGDKTARIWDSGTGEPVGEPLRHDGWVTTAAFSPDGRYVVTASYDKTARIWDVGTGECIFKEVGEIVMSPDMKNIAIVKGEDVYIKPFVEPQQLLDKCRKIVKYFKISPEDRKKYYLE